jgi:non-heme Fe2+,alpha-ketoglutarate-dependent halogenase
MMYQKMKLKPVELKAGQVSLHHPRIVHGSGVNKSNDRRIGFVIQSYIGTNVKQTLGKNGVQIARGEDKFNFHEVIGRPKSLMSKEDLIFRQKETNLFKKFFMQDLIKEVNIR